ncbi:predicted protein [Coccidioides posadasii str. Silveira]|uniref:Predicted protein n=1 Tax=Coccidioides posadasii (strain RMSCC 757 / Silveira) TaxID=443226 RepID=E9DB18_COCPS|nr:predicted protein [Coccidioides posadasii str. Silveira]
MGCNVFKYYELQRENNGSKIIRREKQNLEPPSRSDADGFAGTWTSAVGEADGASSAHYPAQNPPVDRSLGDCAGLHCFPQAELSTGSRWINEELSWLAFTIWLKIGYLDDCTGFPARDHQPHRDISYILVGLRERHRFDKLLVPCPTSSEKPSPGFSTILSNVTEPGNTISTPTTSH